MKKVLVMSVVLATLVWTMGLATFVPAVSAATLTAGDLIKGSGSAVYFYAADGKRYTFPTLSTYMTWYADFSKVKTITDSELAAISLAGNVVVRPGTKLIKIDTVPKVFAVEPKGKLVWVASEAVANTLYGAEWAKRIITIPDGFWTNYTDSGLSLGGTTYPEGQLVKWAGSSNVYYVTGGKKSLVATDAAFAANMWKTADVVTAPVAITLAEGTAIAGVSSTLVDVSQGGGVVATLPTGTGTLTVALAGDTPAASPVAKGGVANFTKFGLTANGAAMTVSKVTLTKGGYSATGDVENIKITDLSGVGLSNSGNLNTNGTVALSFSPALSLAAGETRYFYVRSGVVAGATSGLTASFAIASSSDVVSSAAAVAGNFPVLGNAMSVVAVTIGSVDVREDGVVTDTTPDAGDTNLVVNKFKVEAGTTEAITIESLSVLEVGTASYSDVKNIELWSVTQNKSLGEVTGWDANGKASFGNLNIVVGKGEFHRFQVRLDVVSGAGETVNADIMDGDDVMMSVKGNAYGFYITPDGNDAADWTNANDGRGANDQTINAGALSVSKASTTPATGKVAEAADQLLAIFEFEARGEAMRVSKVIVDVAAGVGGSDGDMLQNCKLLDASGLLVAGPVDGAAADTITFTDTFVAPVGFSKYSVKCRIYDVDGNDFGGLTPKWTLSVTGNGVNVNAKGESTNETITATGTATANQMTLASVSLTAKTLGTPAAQSIAPGTSDFTFATFTLDAANSGEDMNVTDLVLQDTLGDAADDADDIRNVEVWCDMTSASSVRGDVYEKKFTNTENFDDSGAASETLTMDFSEVLVVTKNSFVKCAVIADLLAGALAGDTHQINLDTDAGDVSASGASTGTSESVTPTGAGQVMTVTASGTITVSVDSSSPKASIFISQEMKQTVAVFRIATDSVESMDLDNLMITSNGADDAVDTYYFYSSKRADGKAVTESIASTTGGNTANAIVPDGTVTIPAGGYVLITVKADMSYLDETTVQNGDAITLVIADSATDLKTTGLSSGVEEEFAGAVNPAVSHLLYQARPVVTKDSSSPSGTLASGSSTLVAVFKIDNTSGVEDIVFDGALPNVVDVEFEGVATSGDVGDETVTIKDKNGNALDSVSVNIDNGAVDAQAAFDFTDLDLVVSAGDYELLKVYANTSGYTAAGDSLQVFLQSDQTFTWGANDGGAYATGAITLRGNVYGNSLGK